VHQVSHALTTVVRVLADQVGPEGVALLLVSGGVVVEVRAPEVSKALRIQVIELFNDGDSCPIKTRFWSNNISQYVVTHVTKIQRFFVCALVICVVMLVNRFNEVACIPT